MRNHDTALALVIIGLALTCWAASAIGKRRQKRRLMRIIRDTPQVMPVQQWDLRTRADYTALIRNPAAPISIKVLAASIAHQRGWCTCNPYNQHAELTATDIDWLESQRGAS